jgi:thioredoxin reductase (NADPH)
MAIVATILCLRFRDFTMTTFIWLMIAICGTAVLFVISRFAAGRQAHLIAATAEAPATVHPKFDPAACISTGACITSCPEKDQPIGMVQGKPRLINPSACIGHGDCLRACPVQAIDLVIGTAQRGVDVPALNGNFESSQPGLFIAGELSGMGLIHNSVRQGHVAAEAALRRLRPHQDTEILDLVIVGAGPAGLGAAAYAKQLGANYRVLEKRRIGGAIASYPRGKVVMTAPMRFAGLPPLTLKRTSKESLMEELGTVITTLKLSITPHCDVTSIERQPDGTFALSTPDGTVRAQRVIVAVGRRGAPRKIGAAGDDDARIVYELDDPETYRNQSVLVVGGGDSAIEATFALSRQPDTRVILLHRGANFSRAKPDNQRAIEAMKEQGNVRIQTESIITAIDGSATDRMSVMLTHQGETKTHRAHAIIACLGAELPTGWLSKIGVEVVTRHGEALLSGRRSSPVIDKGPARG